MTKDQFDEVCARINREWKVLQRAQLSAGCAAPEVLLEGRHWTIMRDTATALAAACDAALKASEERR